MFRAILYLIGFMLIMSVIRSVLGIISKAFSGLSNTSHPQAGTSSPQAGASGSRPPSSPSPGGELKKDPVCGTFISTATAFQKFSQGQTYYFCSTECRDKFKG
jgi:YHS domain-containing protein